MLTYVGINALAADCNLGEALRAKLKKVIEWVLSTESALDQIENVSDHNDPLLCKFWNFMYSISIQMLIILIFVMSF